MGITEDSLLTAEAWIRRKDRPPRPPQALMQELQDNGYYRPELRPKKKPRGRKRGENVTRHALWRRKNYDPEKNREKADRIAWSARVSRMMTDVADGRLEVVRPDDFRERRAELLATLHPAEIVRLQELAFRYRQIYRPPRVNLLGTGMEPGWYSQRTERHELRDYSGRGGVVNQPTGWIAEDGCTESA